KAQVFISYSRSDIAFIDRLETGLKERGFAPLIDRTDIYAFEDWWKRIQDLIIRADTIVFVLSPDSVSSEICGKAVGFAAWLNKAFAPVVCRRVDAAAVPADLIRWNWIPLDDEATFDNACDRLKDALSTDIEWIRKQTEFGQQARRWSEAGRPGPRGLLLRSPVLEEAERWIGSRPASAPPPTEATQAFITESRREATRRRNILTGSLTAGLFVALALAGVALWQRNVAIEQERIANQQRQLAEEQRNVAENRRIATLAELVTVALLRGDQAAALRLGGHAARLARDPEHVPLLAASSLAAAVAQSDWGLPLSGHHAAVNFAAFSPDGDRIVTASDDRTVCIWDATTLVVTLRGHEDVVWSAAFSSDGQRIVTASKDRTARIWDSASGREIAALRHDAGVY